MFCNGKRKKSFQRLIAGFLAVCFACIPFTTVFAVQTENTENTESVSSKITVSLTFREFVTGERYFEQEIFEMEADAKLRDLLEACVVRGLIREYLFEEELLQQVVFPNGITFSSGSYGSESGFDLTVEKRKRLPFEDFTLQNGANYQLCYRVSPNDYFGHLQTVEENYNVEIWNDSLAAMLDSACSWLYQNRSRGNPDAVMALGVANRSANPVDVVLLTQLEGYDPNNLSSQIEVLSALAYCGYSPPIRNNKVVLLDLVNFTKPENCTTAQLCDLLCYYDSFSFTIDSGAALSTNAIIAELLKRQNQDGGFSQNQSGSSGIRTTAKAVMVLQNYRDLTIVNTAVLNSISYLSSPTVRDLLFQGNGYTDCVTIAQMILAIVSCDLPMSDIYFTYNGMTYADLLQECFCVSGGFAMRRGEDENEVATAAAIEALCALKKGENPYLREDVSLVSYTLFSESEQEPEEAIQQEESLSGRRISSGFWLAVIFTVSMVLVEVVHYIIYIKRVDRMK